MSHTTLETPVPQNCMQLKACLLGNNFPSLALVDFINSSLVERAGLPVEPLTECKDVNTLGRCLLVRITHDTTPLKIFIPQR